MPLDRPEFIYVVCQHGAEGALKVELGREHPELRLAFSRPGFVTFKVTSELGFPERFALRSTIARTYGWSLGKISGDDANQLAAEVVAAIDQRRDASIPKLCLHVWQRDDRMPGKSGFEPGPTALSDEIGNLLVKIWSAKNSPVIFNQIAHPEELVFDVVLVEPGEWWYGYHFADTVPARWPGGVPFLDTSVETVSRAYYKAAEALAWSGIEILPGDVCAEIGSSPGGCCQLLLELGATVIGIDPAEMEPEILNHKNFVHIRRRGNEVPKRDLKDVKWLFADLIVAPNYALDSVEEIASHSSVDVKGLILTLKLADWKLVEEVPALMNRVRKLGFAVVKARQLAFNRQEFCLIAVKDKFLLRAGKKAAQQQKRRGS